MKKMYKAMALVLCAVLLVAGSVVGTLAYLQSQTQAITNVMTVGNVQITLSESKVNEYGVAEGDEKIIATADGVTGGQNSYKLIPGRTYTKDPMITVQEGSEKCWIFAKLEDGLDDASEITINAGWEQITTNDGSLVYAYNTALAANDSQTLFDSFKFTENANPADYATKSIIITAYAVQEYGFATAQAAWNATFGASNP